MFWSIGANLLLLGFGFYVVSFLNQYIFKSSFIFTNIDYLFYFGVFVILFLELIKKNNSSSGEKIVIQNNFKLTSEQVKKIKELPIKMSFSNSYEQSDFNIVDLKMDKKTNKVFDEVKFLDNGLVEIYNKSGFIDLDNYRSKEKELKHYIGIKIEDSIKINQHESNSIILDIFDRFPKGLELNINDLKKGEIFLGINEKGEKIYIPIKDWSNWGMSGAAGAGKSVQQRLILMSFIFNLDLQDKDGNDYVSNIYLVDYKIVSYSHYAKIHPKIKIAVNNEEIYEMMNEVYNENKKRQNDIKIYNENLEEDEDEKEKIETNAILFLFDEYAEYKDNCPDLKDKEEYKKFDNCSTQLKSIVQTGRSNNIKIFIASQTLKTEVLEGRIRSNLQSRMLMKSKDTESIVACLGSNEPVEELGVNPKLFNYGRMIVLLDTPRGVQNLYVQGLYSPPSFYKEIMKFKNWKTIKINSSEKINLEKDKLIVKELEKNNLVKEEEIIPSQNELINLRKTLWEKSKNMEEGEIKKTVRSQLSKMTKNLESGNYDPNKTFEELKNIENFI